MASSNGIKLTIDKSGRIVVPKPLRERLGLKPGTELEVLDQPGGVLLRTVEERPALVKIDEVTRYDRTFAWTFPLVWTGM